MSPARSARRPEAAESLEALGAEVLIAPTVEIQPPDDWRPVDRAIERLDAFDWLVFTSGNGVRFFLDRLEALGRDLRALGHAHSSPRSAPRRPRHSGPYRLKADLVPESYRSEALAEALAPRIAGRRVLLARADRGRTLLRDEPWNRSPRSSRWPSTGTPTPPALPPAVIERIEAGIGRLDHA